MGTAPRCLAGVVGLALAGLGVWGAFEAKNDAAIAAVVTAGAVLILVSVIGGLERLKFGDMEAVFASSVGGDDELTQHLARKALAQADPDAAHYRAEALAVVLESAQELGLLARPVEGIAGIDALVFGSRIGVDIRTGTHFDLARVAETYNVSLDPRMPLVDAAVMVVRCAPESRAMRSLGSLQLPGSFQAVPWRPGDSSERIKAALDKARES
jgi:hypothetical protein